MATSTGTTTAVQVPKMLEDFTVGLHKNLADKIDGNFVSSALSVHIVLSMVNYGAAGVTAQEMRSALRLSQNDDESNYQGFHDFINTLNNISNVTLKLANKMYGSQTIEIKEKFKKITSSYFYSKSETLDFSKKASVKTINKWCSDETDGKIPKMFDEDELNKNTAMVLLNALYFKGNWKHKFNKQNTKMAPFHVDKSTTVSVPTMRIEEEFFYKYLKEIDADCVAIPYENDDVLMIIIVPKQVDNLKNVENNFEKITFDHQKDLKGSKIKVSLSLPKFNVESEINMIPHLQQMGINSAFDNNANFSGIADQNLKISSVKQKAVIEIDEEGAEAAAITGLTLMKMSMPLPPITIKIDKPFLYKIVYKSNTIFSGRIMNPLKKN